MINCISDEDIPQQVRRMLLTIVGPCDQQTLSTKLNDEKCMDFHMLQLNSIDLLGF